MKKLFIFFTAASFAFAMMACNNTGKQDTETNKEETTTEVVTPENTEDLGKAFLDNFYKNLEEVFGQEDDFLIVKEHFTPNAQQYLLDAYDYECPDNLTCAALWLFLYEGGADTAGNYERTIEKIDDLTYRVVNNYRSEDDDFNYKYCVKLGLVKEGDTYKIDSITPESESDSE